MTMSRLAAIGFIYLGCAIAWSVLGGSVVSRTGEYDQRLAAEVTRLWGGRHVQVAPAAEIEEQRVVVENVPTTLM